MSPHGLMALGAEGLAPWWVLYLCVVLVLGALTGLGGWMVHRGIRLFAALITMSGLGLVLAAIGLAWQHQAGQAISALALVGVAVFAVGFVAAWRTRTKIG